MIELDIFSDTVCPWCYIGKKRLEKAIEKHSHLEIKQTWRPFQLNPGMPPDGMDRQEYLVSKFGSADAAKTIYDNIFEEGKKEESTQIFDSEEPQIKEVGKPNSLFGKWIAERAKETKFGEAVLRKSVNEKVTSTDEDDKKIIK